MISHVILTMISPMISYPACPPPCSCQMENNMAIKWFQCEYSLLYRRAWQRRGAELGSGRKRTESLKLWCLRWRVPYARPAASSRNNEPRSTAHQLEVAVHNVKAQYKLQGDCCTKNVFKTFFMFYEIYEFRTSESTSFAPVRHFYGNGCYDCDQDQMCPSSVQVVAVTTTNGVTCSSAKSISDDVIKTEG